MTCNYLPNIGKGRTKVSSFFYVLTFSLLIVAFACIPAVADPIVQITQCGTVISQPGHYILANDLNCGGPVAPTSGPVNPALVTPWQQMQNPFSGSGGQAPTPNPASAPFGILITADHVDLALDGHTISGNFNAFTVGIAVSFFASSGNSHVHITGPGTVTQWFVGVLLVGDSFSSVAEVTADTNGAGFLDISGSKNAFDGNTATNNAFFTMFAGGITLLGATDDSVRNNTISSNVFGIVVEGGTGNDVRFNTVTNNFGVGIGIAATDNSIFHNTAQNTVGGPDLSDLNANCDSNTWKHNTFGTADQPCIQ